MFSRSTELKAEYADEDDGGVTWDDVSVVGAEINSKSLNNIAKEILNLEKIAENNIQKNKKNWIENYKPMVEQQIEEMLRRQMLLQERLDSEAKIGLEHNR